MTFLEGQSQKVHFKKAKLHQDKDGERIATISISFEVTRGTPGLTETMERALRAMSNDPKFFQVKIDESIDGQNLFFRSTPDLANPSQQLLSVSLVEFVIRREDEPNRLMLDFDFTVRLDELSPKWLCSSYGYEHWLVTEEAQRPIDFKDSGGGEGKSKRPN